MKEGKWFDKFKPGEYKCQKCGEIVPAGVINIMDHHNECHKDTL